MQINMLRKFELENSDVLLRAKSIAVVTKGEKKCPRSPKKKKSTAQIKITYIICLYGDDPAGKIMSIVTNKFTSSSR